MTKNFVVRGPDERFHEFKQVNTGGWQHWSHLPGELHTLEDEGRAWNLQEVRDQIETLNGFGPITENEVKWIKLHSKNGQMYEGVDWSQSGVEVEADPTRVRTEPQFYCVECGEWFAMSLKRRFTWETFPPSKGVCAMCHAKRIQHLGYHG